MRRNVPDGWSVMEHRAVQFRPMPMGMPFAAAISIVMLSILFIIVSGQVIIVGFIDAGLITIAKGLTMWHPFGWRIMAKNFAVPKVLWS